MLLIALVIAILLVGAAGIGGGLYLIVRPGRVVGNAYSLRSRRIMLVALRVAGAAMAGVALVVLYLSYWTATGGPVD